MSLKKGIIQVLPVLILATVLSVGIYAATSFKSNNAKILSSSDENKGSGETKSASSNSDSGSSGFPSKNEDDSSDRSSTSGSNSSGPGSKETTRIESKTGQGTTKIETGTERTKIKIRNEQGRFESKIENGKEETKIRTGNLRIEIKKEGDKIVTKIKNEDNEEVKLEDEEKDKLFDELEQELKGDDIKIATDSGKPEIIQNGRRVRTNFPLTINPATGELFVTTPSGEKVVTTLPDQAIQNMLDAGILTRINPEPTPQPTPLPNEGTPSATPLSSGIELTEENNQIVYIISGVKNENLLGIIPLDLKIKTVVSTETGQLIRIQRGLLTRVLELLSF